ncbi:EamA family transporter [Arthrobacter sp. MYb211]|nr:EamA family transporter [Arthrobacter sp. MYb221]PRC08687.1 EamA family transporter [Arthrobacter sp. MYb211]
MPVVLHGMPLYCKSMTSAFPRLRRALPDLVLLIVAIMWGGSYLATQDLAAASSAAAVMCARFLPSAAILLCVHLSRPQFRLRDSALPGMMLGTLRAATIALETIGVTLTSATNAGLIIALSILLTPILESALTKRRLSPSLVASILLALIGIMLLVGGQSFSELNLGDGLMLAAAATRALLGVAEARFTVGKNADVLGLTTMEIVFGAAIFAAWGGSSLLDHIPDFGAANWLTIGYLCLGCTIFAFLGQLWATKHTSASRAGMLLGTEPGWALLVGVLLAGERIGTLGYAGAAVLLFATWWGARAERRWRGSGPSRPKAPAPVVRG